MRFQKLDLNLLVVLDVLLATRSVSRAAERVFLSQPATSLALGRLRAYFGDELLVPVGKTLVPTPLAEQLIKPVRDILLQIQTVTRARPTFDPVTAERRFIIEASDYVIVVLLAEVVRRAARLAPQMQFDLRAISPQTQENLDSGHIELLIEPDFAIAQGHPCELLFEDSYACLVCEAHFAPGVTISSEAYFKAAHVTVEWGGGRRVTQDARVLAGRKRVRRQDVIAPNFMLVPELVVGTPRIATLPARLAQHMAARFPLRVVPCPIAIPKLTEFMQWHKYQENDPAISWLRGLIRATAKELMVRPQVSVQRRRKPAGKTRGS